jgi:Zn-dependent peptidase ImmA (M78 family)/transcriptional regulator with XRE-family HTH domain
MRVGTPGFVAQRLTEAREARGLAQTALSELTGIKSQSISHYEQGRQSPSPEALGLLCEKLEVPERYFLKPLPERDAGPVFFRSPKPHVRTARLKAERRLGWLKEIAAYLRRHVDLPAAAVPDLPVGVSAGAAEIEGAAGTCRQQFRLGSGPLAAVVPMLENLGCIVSRCLAGCESEGACSHWDGGMPCILLSDDCASRIRFDAAHELGHLAMHRGYTAEALGDVDTHRVLEQQADRFARAFLMPARAFGREVWAPTVDALLALKKEWNCPVGAMIARCGEIGAFDADQVRRAQVNLSRRGQTEEPRGQTEEPRLLARGIRLLIDARVRDRHGFLTDLSFPAGDIEQLTGLPAGYFSECEVPPAAVLRLREAGVERDSGI